MRGLQIRRALKLAGLAACMLGSALLLALTAASFSRTDDLSFTWKNIANDDALERFSREKFEHRLIAVSATTGKGTCRITVIRMRDRTFPLLGPEGWRHQRRGPTNTARDSWILAQGAGDSSSIIGWPLLHYWRVSNWTINPIHVKMRVYRPQELWVAESHTRSIAFPLWLPAVLLLIPPGIAYIRHRRRQTHGFPVTLKQPASSQ